MKLQELLESAQSLSPAKVQKVVYDYILDNLAAPAQIKKELKIAFENDGFWVPEFDDLYNSVSRGNYDTILDSLAGAIEAVASSIKDHYIDPANHEPGYKAQKLTVDNLEFNAIPSKDLDELITKLDPSIIDDLKKKKKIEDTKLADLKKSKVAAAKDKIDEVAEFVKKYDAASWKEYFAVLKKAKRVDDFLPSQFANGKLDIRSIKSAEDLKNKFVKLPSSTYMETVLDNIVNLPELEKSDDKNVKFLMQTLRTMVSDSSLSTKLFAKIR